VLRILGIWDGHDAGAAVLVDGRIVAAINEERLTRRKLEPQFPTAAIRECLTLAGLAPGDVDVVAASTSDIAKTLARLAPFTKEGYYQVRRRKAPHGLLSNIRSRAKYRITEWGPNPLSRAVSLALLRRHLAALGFGRAQLRLYDHHECHALAAACTSGFDPALVITIDGVGDGASSTVSRFEGGRLDLMASTPARDSIGVFFEHVTTLLNMRELEDEGKVMALADFTPSIPDERNPLMSFVELDGLRFRLAVPGHALRSRLRGVLWHWPNEQFALMAQRVVERAMTSLAREAARRTGLRRVAFAGGVASNIKATRLVRMLPEFDELYVFPHMGDGGLAFGAAVAAARECGEPLHLDLSDLGFGPSYRDDEIERACSARGLAPQRSRCLVQEVAELLAAGQIVLWFQGRMEYGPRALGHRSVLARPDRPALKDRLNLVLKRRVWYQPFCPSLLESDARRLFADWKGAPNRHMSTAYQVHEADRAALAGVINIDGSCRPQIVADDAPGEFADLLRALRARVGVGALLNTSFNLHGEPLVCTPQEALDVFRDCGADALAIGPYLLRR
jgi:carbamoyltransferase